MPIDYKKANNLLRSARSFIEMSGMENDLTEEKIEEAIKRANTAAIEILPEEFQFVKRELQYQYPSKCSPGHSLFNDYDQEKWYEKVKSEIEPKFWNRYKNFLIDSKNFSPNVVNTLGDDTLDDKLMYCIGNPKSDIPFLRRGLIIGDVQSGKTSTYIGLMCKAADAGYKVFILLTGTIESLRRQTQERVEEGFIGIDMSGENGDGVRVGVGLDNKPLFAKAMTSRKRDFTGDIDTIADSLANNNQAIVFVIKKNTTTLQKLTKWLVKLNADPSTGKINEPMLMIDDEADNASINTSKDKEDPTKINKLIRKLANIFTKSNYVGFTATPFANVFIDPETTEKMETQDLFPEDFIVSLPTPDTYVGAAQIYPENGKFHNQLIYIKDAGYEKEDDYPFYFKHKKEWHGELPESLTDAIYSFYIANTLRDLRGDIAEHRSMLVNISRFVAVQKYIKSQIDEIHKNAYRAIKFNSGNLKDPVIKRLFDIFNSIYSSVEFSWMDISGKMYESIEHIKIRVVNSSKDSEKLIYPKDGSLRVTAIGGLALSRGLTLEGLITSYFYRNTSTYDVLMQMGRWFGYRKNYEDLFRIWTAQSSAEWYAEIAEATEDLKMDMELMHDQNLKPKDFGIRVRYNSNELQITSYNKMRNTTDEYDVDSYFGGCIETPYLLMDRDVQERNFSAINQLVEDCVQNGISFKEREKDLYSTRLMLRNVPKEYIIDFISKITVSKFCIHFDTTQIHSFLTDCNHFSIDYFDVAFMEGKDPSKTVSIGGSTLNKVVRNKCSIDTELGKINIGRKGKLGGSSDGIIGIEDCNNLTAEQIVENAKNAYAAFNHIQTKSIIYPSNTWFKYIENRKPLLIIYLLDINYEDLPENQKKNASFDSLKHMMGSTPFSAFMMGFPQNLQWAQMNFTRYKTNKKYNYYDISEMNELEEEE